MTTIPLPLIDGDTLLIDNSAMEKFQTCPRSSEFSTCRRLSPAGDTVALHFGGIIHRILEARYRAATSMCAQTDEVTAVMEAVAREEFSKWTPPEDDYRNLDCAIRLIHQYAHDYPFEDFEVVRLPDGRPFVEVPFMVPLFTTTGGDFLVQDMTRLSTGEIVPSGMPHPAFFPQIRVMWTGRIDLAYTTQHGLYLMDHKTSSMSTNMAEFEISHQFYGYADSVASLLNRRVSGITINRMVCRKPTRIGIPFTLERKLITFSPSLLEDWYTDICYIVTDFLEMVRRGHMPKHTVWCVNKFGTCPFHKVCTLDTQEQREVMLTSGEFQENKWSPLT